MSNTPDYLRKSIPEGRRISAGWFEPTDNIRANVNEVLDSGMISYGKFSRVFEQEFAKFHGANYGILSNSGTSSLHVAVQALKELYRWNDGDEVIVPATTFVATPNVVIHNKLRPVFVDIEKQTYGIDPKLIEAKITDRTRAIMPVHLFGQACNMDDVLQIANTHNLKIIEDSCETMFVKHNDAPVGSIGDIGCFSMYVAHLINAGVGGIAITNNEDYARKMRSLVNHGLSYDNLNMDGYAQPQPMMGRRFHFDTTGHSFRITEFEAAVAYAQLEDYKSGLRIRQRNGKHLTAGLNRINDKFAEQLFFPAQWKVNQLGEIEHAFMMYPIVLNRFGAGATTKQSCISYLNQHSIETRDMLPLLGQPAFKYLPPQDFPVSRWVEQCGFYVGSHPWVTPIDVEYIIQTLEDWAHQEFK